MTGLGLVAGSAGARARHVRLPRWLDHKWLSELENVGGDSEGETDRGVTETKQPQPHQTKRGKTLVSTNPLKPNSKIKIKF